MTTLQSDDCQINDPNNLFPMTIDSLRFPLDTAMRVVFTGHFNGFSVLVRSVDEINLLYQMGCFGKGSFSRSKPNQKDVPQIIRKRQFLKRNYWYKKFSNTAETSESDIFLNDIEDLSKSILSDFENSKKDVIDLVSSDEEDIDASPNSPCPTSSFVTHAKEDMVVIVPNSDSEDDNYFANLKPQCCVNKIKIQEQLILMLEEAFFLSFGLGCLQVVNGEKLLNIQQCWELFTETDKNFVHKYVVYHYYRAKGYVVKPGIKFGGDYLLYKGGPGFSHADYIVVLRNNCVKNWISLLGLIRMATTTVKEIIIAEVLTSEGINKLPEDLNKYSVREMLLTRNIPTIAINDDVD